MIRSSIFSQTSISGTTQVDAASKAFTLAAYAHLPHELAGASWRIVLDEDASKDWAILNAEEERSLHNTLLTQSWARECRSWLQSGKAAIRCAPIGLEGMVFCTGDTISGGLVGACSLNAQGLGLLPYAGGFSCCIPMEPKQCESIAKQFDVAWDSATASPELENKLDFLSQTHPAAWVYYKACYKLLDNAKLPKDYIQSETGFYDSLIWKKLFSYQRDGVESMLEMLERFGGCILADSVGLGKTYEALAVIRYYQLKNKKVLVLCPKRLSENWDAYRYNSIYNEFAEQPFHYDLFHHTDLGRSGGKSHGRSLDSVEWGNYDLVVIDESHNFRNRSTKADKTTSRYDFLMRKVVQAGIKTKILLLSATPVNNKASDLRNQILLISGDQDDFLKPQGIESISNTTRLAQAAFTSWTRLPEEERTSQNLLDSLGMDYFQLLNLLTIGRSRKHIKTWYPHDAEGVNLFPEQLPVRNTYAENKHGVVLPVERINEMLAQLNMASYRPLEYLYEEYREEYSGYDQQIEGNRSFKQSDRENSLSALMMMNLLKRMESSVHSFALTLSKQIATAEDLLAKLDLYQENQNFLLAAEEDEFADDDLEEFSTVIGQRIKVDLKHIQRERWRNDIAADLSILRKVKELCVKATPQNDAKLGLLRNLISGKMAHPLNIVDGRPNRKIIIFTAYTDTAQYLYESLAQDLLSRYGVYTALLSGSKRDTNLDAVKKRQEDLLAAFSPKSKNGFDAAATGGREIDILIATDCISEGQNLQGCDYLINYDIHWNPVRIIQRFGRIDRIGSPNKQIQLVNIWPMPDLDAYINLERRVLGRMTFLKISATDADFRDKQLKSLRAGKLDIDSIDQNCAISDLSMHQYRADLTNFRKKHRNLIEKLPSYFTATLNVSGTDIPAGAFFLLCSHASMAAASRQYPFMPYFLMHVAEDGTVTHSYTHVKKCLDMLRATALPRESVDPKAEAQYMKQTNNARKMKRYSELLAAAVRSVTGQTEESQAASIFSPGGTTIAKGGKTRGVDDFEVLAMLTLTHHEN